MNQTYGNATAARDTSSRDDNSLFGLEHDISHGLQVLVLDGFGLTQVDSQHGHGLCSKTNSVSFGRCGGRVV